MMHPLTLQSRAKESVLLVLSRRVGEFIRIGNDVRLTILGIKGTQVKLGILAPKSISVDREELRLKKEAELK